MGAVMLTPQQLRGLQLVQLELLEEADRICRKHGIRYSLAGGTLLGAVRHKGYIPWDDDTDIILLRPEYERFKAAFEQETDHSRFYFQDQRTTPGYRWGYGKIRRKNTLYVRDGQEYMPYGQEINIDVFPLDHVPDGAIASRLHKLHCWALRKILWSEVGRQVDRCWYKRLTFGVLSRIPLESVVAHYEALAARSNRKGGRGVRPLLGGPLPKGCLYEGEAEWYQSYREILFEGKYFQAICAIDLYLARLYGDYMTPPPESQREGHPASAVKLIEGDVFMNEVE